MKKEFEKERKDNQTEDMFGDMPDMDDDEKFSQWLEDEYLKEADAIEESLLAGRRYEDHPEIAQKLSVSRESFYQRAREEGLLDEETDEHVTAVDSEIDAEKKAPEEERVHVKSGASEVGEPETMKVVEFRKKKHGYVRLGRIAGIAGVCLICVFAASMSSEANRNHFIKKVQYLTGNDARIVVGNDDENEDIKTDEYEAIRDIENKLSVSVPEFYYRPQGMQFLDYEVNQYPLTAWIEYQCPGYIITLYIDKSDGDTASNTSSVSGTQTIIDTIQLENDLKVSINEIEEVGDALPTYMAQWTKGNVAYYLSGKTNLNEIKKIIKYMKF